MLLAAAIAILDQGQTALDNYEYPLSVGSVLVHQGHDAMSFSACLAPFNPLPLPLQEGGGSGEAAGSAGRRVVGVWMSGGVEAFMETVWKHAAWLTDSVVALGRRYHAQCVLREQRACARARLDHQRWREEHETSLQQQPAEGAGQAGEQGRRLFGWLAAGKDEEEDLESGDATWTWKEGAGRSAGGEGYQLFDATRVGVAVASSALTKAWRQASGTLTGTGPLAEINKQAQTGGWVTLKQGWLVKRGQVMRSWKRRFFVLKLAPWLADTTGPLNFEELRVGSLALEIGGVLEYLDAEDGESKGAVFLSCRSSCQNCSDGEFSRPHSFVVEEERGARALAACAPEGAQERAEWVRAICGVLRQHAAAVSAAR
jgi:hypothetical protein